MRITTFTVSGIVPFPTDMLRYDQCFPADGHSAAQIVSSIERNKDARADKGFYEVKLCHQGSDIRWWLPTFDRWSSFMWSVDPESVKSESIK